MTGSHQNLFTSLQRKNTSKTISTSLSEQIYQKLKWALITGQYLPGDALSIRSLAGEFDTSMMPVREALKRLVAERALTSSSTRSFKVTELSPTQVSQLFFLRSILEGAAAKIATHALTNEQIDQLHESALAIERHANHQDFNSYLADNYSFHFTIYNATGNFEMTKIIENIWAQISPSLYVGLRDYSDKKDWLTDHEQIVQSLRTRNESLTQTLIEKDINWGTALYRNLNV